MNHLNELHQVMLMYLENEHQTMELGERCPSCGAKIKNEYSDSVANVMSESCDICHACGLVEEFAYGATRISYEGNEVPDDVVTQQIILGLLRKFFIHKKEFQNEEVELLDVFLMKKEVNETELEELLQQVIQLNQ
ncbi:hypothetical protein JMA_40640 (plasmid) [Jeotgalibacillus malaysiensis]|uniref:Uncharacterized protein n=1 Tax=Jeotgalibacillus malaysiensis TaxID=1508404 RepID=A0A0B5AXH7_9BACL|nr:hypothetical protein [Jeotgalibacillus malaysiensis]AJD93382.1 hypothetical protein JMA_40640 [Jeotgalibacillus malaysiensis]